MKATRLKLGIVALGVSALLGYLFFPSKGSEETWLKTPTSLPVAVMESAPKKHPKPVGEILNYLREKKVKPRRDILNEFNALVYEEKILYDIIFNQYDDTIKQYENLSSEFDLMIRDGASTQLLSDHDTELQIKAQEVLGLKRKSNAAYVALMAKYDSVAPIILAKYFEERL